MAKKPTKKKAPRKTVSGQIRKENKEFFAEIEAPDKFWEARAKNGRPKIFSTPTDLWDACVEYFEYNSKRSVNKVDFRGGFATRVVIPTPTPMTIEGLCLFLGVNTKYLWDFKDGLKKDDIHFEGFSEIITRVEGIIFQQQYEGASAGMYNANIIARKLGLTDKKEIKVSEQPLFPDDIKNDSK
jgi:hypothetical protein